MVRQREIERDSSVPLLVRCAVRHIGNFEVRNRGTVGGRQNMGCLNAALRLVPVRPRST
jgi:CO/xanthine dehydrogenase FAD-binding subunit